MRFTSCIPALDMLKMPLVSLSKPVGPNMFMNVRFPEGLQRYQKVCAPTEFRVILSKFHTKSYDTFRNHQGAKKPSG